MNSESAQLATETIQSLPTHESIRTIQDRPPPVDDLLVVAEKPDELQAAQSRMIAWATSRVAEVRREIQIADEGLENARKRKYPTGPFRAMAKRMREELTYYEKMRDALTAGYVIVPNFDVQLFAIRTTRLLPEPRTLQSTWTKRPLPNDERADASASGSGEYHSPAPQVSRWSEQGTQDGKSVTVYKVRPIGFVDPKYPAVMCKPQVLDATERAMALKIFDQFGCTTKTRKEDPIITGQIIRPGGRVVSFLVAWWIDTADL